MSPIKAAPPVKGLPPLEQPVAGLAIEQRLNDERARKDDEHAANRSDTPAMFTASDGYSCERKIAFGRLGVPKDITYDAAALMTFKAGDFYHQIAQEALVQWLDCRCEVDFDWRPVFSLYGRCDGVYERGRRTVVEIKSQAGYGFDLATGAKRSNDGPGPKLDHLMQAGFAALSPTIQADAVHIVYINKDRGVVAEWIVGVDDELPHLGGATVREIVSAEIVRLTAVAATMDAGHLPAREIPGYGLVEGDPPEKDSRDQPWNCRYCSWQPTCSGLAPIVEQDWITWFLAEKEAGA